VQQGTPADQAGLRAGDAIQSVDGPLPYGYLVLAYLQTGKGKPVTLVVLRTARTAACRGTSGQAG